MSYKGSYIWQLRQKVGNKTLMTTTVDVVVINQRGYIKLVYSNEFASWSIIAGHVEQGQTYLDAALSELYEEAGIVATKDQLIPFATVSGPDNIIKYADGQTNPFTLCFVIKSWMNETDYSDKEEIGRVCWFDLEEALQLELVKNTRWTLQAYQKYLETGNFQMVEIDTSA